MSLIDTLAQAIGQMEGYFKSGSVADRNNNPGNLRASPYAIGKDANGYAIFPDAQTGWNALYYQLNLYSQRGLTLEQMINVYAPASDNNDPNNYLNFVTGKLGVGPNTSISSLYETQPAVSTDVPTDNADPTTIDSTNTADVLSSGISDLLGGTGNLGLLIGAGLLGLVLVKLIKG